MRIKKAFTLIELLVVIAIIALLLSILMPSLQKVKEQARNLICATNLKTLFTAWTMYSGSNDEKICSSYSYGAFNSIPWKDESSWAWLPWDEANDQIVPVGELQSPKETADVSDEERYEGIRRGSLWPYTGDVDVFHCTSEKTRYHFRSYSIPDCMGGYWGRNLPGWIGPGAGEYTIHLKINSITRPSNSYVFLEENDWRAVLWDSFVLFPGFLNTPNPTWGDPLTIRHKGASSFVFGDGHTEFYLWSKDTVDFMEEPFGVWGSTPQTLGETKDIEWLIGHWSK